ncbi:MAG: NADPH-dependent oxidoreductase [Chloroflexota bacterium]
MNQSNFDTPLIETMRDHRSIRAFKDQPLPEGMLEHIISAAQMASTSSFLQQYSVIAVQDRDRKARLAKLAGNQDFIRDCPVLLVFCADVHRLARVSEIEGTQINSDYVESFLVAAIDTALLAQNVALAAESLGLGIVYIGGIRSEPKGVIEELALPGLVFPLVGMCVGYPSHIPDKKTRLPLPAVLHREQYQEDELHHYLDAYDTEIQRQELFKHMETGEVYGWMARAARRMAYTDPKRLRVEMRQVLQQQGFGME